MTFQVQEDRLAMSQRERDVLKVLQSVVDGKRTQAEAARLLDLSSRQVRRLQRKLEAHGDGCLIHGLRGRASNRGYDAKFRTKVLRAYRQRYSDFGPTLASEKRADEKLIVCPETLRTWLLAEGLWQRQRKRDPHRSRRPCRSCFGELVQMDAAIHNWLEGRGEEMVADFSIWGKMRTFLFGPDSAPIWSCSLLPGRLKVSCLTVKEVRPCPSSSDVCGRWGARSSGWFVRSPSECATS